jgi:hypothetical protein
MRRGYVVALVMVLGLMLVPATAGATVFTVNTINDTPAAGPLGCAGAAGDCSLRQAIESANANAGDDTINFGIPTPATIQLNDGPLRINPAASSSDALTINGPGAKLLTVDQVTSGNSEVFHFTRGKNTLTGVTITGGSQSSFNGAGIDKGGGTLVLDSSVVTGNFNDAQNFQGAGGVLNVNGLMTIRNSTISNNNVINADSGGGAGVVSHPGNILIVNSTISGNHIYGNGSNSAGGLWNAQGGGTMTLLNVTVSKNTSLSGPGGLENEGNKVRLGNTILAGNTTGGGNFPDCETLVISITTSQGYNLIGSGDGCSLTPQAGDKIGTNASPIDPKLLPLADYTGPTPTMALVSSSPALNGGNPAAVSDNEPPDAPPALLSCRTTDQRGIVRPQLGTCDIGAYEYGPGEALATVPPCSSNGLVTVTVTPPQGGFAQAVRYKIDGGPETRATTTNNQATVTVPAGQHTLTYWAESQGGDQELTQHTASVLVDPTPPVVQIRSDQRRVTYRRGQFASVTITASDSGSALTSNPSRRRLRISTSRLGRRTISAAAVDTCGNRATAAYTYRVIAQRSARKPARRRGGRPRFTG